MQGCFGKNGWLTGLHYKDTCVIEDFSRHIKKRACKCFWLRSECCYSFWKLCSRVSSWCAFQTVLKITYNVSIFALHQRRLYANGAVFHCFIYVYVHIVYDLKIQIMYNKVFLSMKSNLEDNLEHQYFLLKNVSNNLVFQKWWSIRRAPILQNTLYDCFCI